MSQFVYEEIVSNALDLRKKKRGPYASEIDTAMQYIYSYLEENSEECQFSLDELMTKIEGDYRPHIKKVKVQLLKKYGDDILIAVTANKAPVFVFDNADFNMQTLDGIHCITPKSAIAPDQNIERLKLMPSAKVVDTFGAIELKTFTKKNDTGLKTIKIQDLDSIHAVAKEIIPSVSDLLWLYGKSVDLPNIPEWSGFMEQATAELPFEKSFIGCLPFINAPPSGYDTILTALLFACEKCESLHQHTCFVTFDQPLYFKAREIISLYDVNSKLNNTVIRLGRFYLLMSFMESIGYIMNGSGLKELFNTIYALNSIEKIMVGHAYSRAVRAHMLTHLAIARIVLQFIDLTPDLSAELDRILYNFDRSVVLEADQEECCKELADKFANELIKLEQRGATAKL
ncbi:hypothetical protein EVAR_89569_1 [Eumeta japonica]|uniref:Uncharacterized protein n=1 Tax=Eumeta variegata TaxID=151549 RepID=A0A4C1YUE4_EUMVA|nr:hypothetical protein EVAR_89569_1 [Eumeta japonica]